MKRWKKRTARARWVKCGPLTKRSYFITEEIPDERAASIVFLPCKVRSHHPQDIRHRYCAYCNRSVDVQGLDITSTKERPDAEKSTEEEL